MPATFRLTREWMALVAPDFDPDDESEDTSSRLCELLGGSDFREWLERHPDQELVEEYRREEDRYVREFVSDLALHLVNQKNTKEVVIEHDDGRLTVLRPNAS
jgi:hypothetical protein